MADREVDFLLVGGGMAGASCASELRKQGAEGSILLAGREPAADDLLGVFDLPGTAGRIRALPLGRSFWQSQWIDSDCRGQAFEPVLASQRSQHAYQRAYRGT